MTAPTRGVGRPRIAPGGTKNYVVTLDAATVDTLRLVGDGNLSAGIRHAAAMLRPRRRAKQAG